MCAGKNRLTHKISLLECLTWGMPTDYYNIIEFCPSAYIISEITVWMSVSFYVVFWPAKYLLFLLLLLSLLLLLPLPPSPPLPRLLLPLLLYYSTTDTTTTTTTTADITTITNTTTARLCGLLRTLTSFEADASFFYCLALPSSLHFHLS